MTWSLFSNFVLSLLLFCCVNISFAQPFLLNSVNDKTNHSPTMNGDQIFVGAKNQVIKFKLAGASDKDGDSLAYSLVLFSGPGELTNCLNNTSSLSCVYTPVPDFRGEVTFSYKANDGLSDSVNINRVILRLDLPNRPPQAIAEQSFTSSSSDGFTFKISSGFDPDGDDLKYQLVGQIGQGTLTNCLNNTAVLECHFQPSSLQNEIVTITYKAFDGLAYSSIGKIVLRIGQVNQRPIMNGDQVFKYKTGTSLKFSLAGASDANRDTLIYELESPPAFGKLQGCLNNTSSLSCEYFPDPSFRGPVTFTYKAYDSQEYSPNRSTVTIIPEGPSAPIASASANPLMGEIPVNVTFDATLSYDPDGGLVQKYIWDFKDGSPTVETFIPYVNHAFTQEGFYNVELRVVDDEGQVSSPSLIEIQALKPNQAPVAQIATSQSSGVIPLTVTFSSNGSYDPDGSIIKTLWTFPDGSTSEQSSITHTFSTLGDYNVSLTVTDNRNKKSTSTIVIHAIEDHNPPLLVMAPEDGSVINIDTPLFTFNYSDAESAIDVNSIRITLDDLDVTNKALISDAMATLQFTTLWPMSEGNHTIKISLSDRSGNTKELSQSYRIDLGKVKESYLVGQVVDSNGSPISGASVSVDEGPVGFRNGTSTDAQGFFKIPFTQSGKYAFHITKTGWTDSIKKTEIYNTQDTDVGLFTLASADPIVVPMKPETGGEIVNSTDTLSMTMNPGVLPYPVDVRLTEFTDGNSLPGPLPEMSAFTYAFDVQPRGLQLLTNENPGQIILKEQLGFPVGTELVYGYFDQKLGRWLDSGNTVKIVENGRLGSKASIPPSYNPLDVNQPTTCGGGGCRTASGSGGGGGGGQGGASGNGGGCGGGNSSSNVASAASQCSECGAMGGGAGSGGAGGASSGGDAGGQTAGGASGCRINLNTGNLALDHYTPTIKRGDDSISLQFAYSSLAAYPTFFAGPKITNNFPDPADGVNATISILGQTVRTALPGEALTKTALARVLVDAKNPEGVFFSSGVYSYDVIFETKYNNSIYAAATYFGGPPGLPLGVTSRVPLTFKTAFSDRISVLNYRNSSFGAGWNLVGLERLYIGNNGTVLHDTGGAHTRVYTPIEGTGTSLRNSFPKFVRDITSLSSKNGHIYAADCEGNKVYLIDSEGRFIILAGNGERGFSGDGGKATRATLNCPMSVYPAETGGIYIADSGNRRIRRVDANGVIRTIAGNGKNTQDSDGVNAANASIGMPLTVSEDKMRAVHFVVDNKIRFINPRGQLETYAGSNDSYVPVRFENPTQVLYDAYDYPIIVDKDNNRIITLYPQSKKAEVLIGENNSKNKKGEISLSRPMSISFDPIFKRYFILEESGRLLEWSGPGGQRLTVLAESDEGKLVKAKRSDSTTSFRAMTFSPELGLVLSDGKSINAGFKTNNKNHIRGDVQYLSEPNDMTSLLKKSDGTFERVYPTGEKVTYNAKGFITSKLYSKNRNTFYTYDSSDRLVDIKISTGEHYSFFYDGRGYLEKVIDPAQRETHFVVDKNGNLVSIINPDNSKKTYAYNTDHIVSTEIEENGKTTGYSFFKGRLIKETQKSGQVRLMKPAAVLGLIDTSKMRSGVIKSSLVTPSSIVVEDTSISGDCASKRLLFDNGTAKEVTDCLGRKTVYGQDVQGNSNLKISPEGRRADYQFDEKNRTIYQNHGNGFIKTQYDSVTGKVSAIQKENGGTVHLEYGDNKEISTYKDQYDNVTQLFYGPENYVSKIVDSQNNETLITRDQYLNVISVSDSLSNTVEYKRDLAGNTTEIKDSKGLISFYEYDSMNRVTKIKDPLSYVTSFGYQNGMLSRLTNASGSVTSFEYNTQNQKLSKIVNPLGFEEQYSYDSNNRLVKKTNKDGTDISYIYNLVGQLMEIVAGNTTQRFSYDNDGLITLALADSRNNKFEYDLKGNLVKIFQDEFVLFNSYYNNGYRSRLDVEDVLSIGYAYRLNGQIETISASILGKQISLAISYDKLNRPIDEQFSNGIGISKVFDSVSRLTSLKYFKETKVLKQFQYGFDKNGNILSIDETNRGPINYGYDSSGRLIHSSKEGSFSYDPLGNQIQWGQKYNELNQILEDQVFTYSFTLNGNLEKKINRASGETFSYFWNTQNQLIGVQKSISSKTLLTIAYKYDALGKRVSKEVVNLEEPQKSYTRIYYYDGENVLFETDKDKNVVAAYLHGANIDDPLAMVRMENNKAVVYYYIKDHLGSVKALVDENGNPVQEYEYGAYGKTKVGRVTDSSPTSFVENRYAYTSREWEEETGDYYYRARYYDPSEGRFLSEDPIGFSGGDWNLYRYVTNDPIYNKDSNGLDSAPGEKKKGRFDRFCDSFNDFLGGLIPDPAQSPTPTPTPTSTPASDGKSECKKQQQLNKELLNSPACQSKPDQPICRDALKDPCIIDDYDNGVRK